MGEKNYPLFYRSKDNEGIGVFKRYWSVWGLNFDDDPCLFLQGNGLGWRVEVRDAETLKLKYHLPSGPDPELFVLSPDDSILYIANEDDAMVTVVDMNEKMIIDDIPVGVEPEGMGLVGNGSILVNTSTIGWLIGIIIEIINYYVIFDI